MKNKINKFRITNIILKFYIFLFYNIYDKNSAKMNEYKDNQNYS